MKNEFTKIVDFTTTQLSIIFNLKKYRKCTKLLCCHVKNHDSATINQLIINY